MAVNIVGRYSERQAYITSLLPHGRPLHVHLQVSAHYLLHVAHSHQTLAAMTIATRNMKGHEPSHPPDAAAPHKPADENQEASIPQAHTGSSPLPMQQVSL